MHTILQDSSGRILGDVYSDKHGFNACIVTPMRGGVPGRCHTWLLNPATGRSLFPDAKAAEEAILRAVGS